MTRPQLVTVVAAAVVSLLVGGCSSSPPLDEYVASMETSTDAYVTESQQLSFEYQSSVEDGVRSLIAEETEDPGAAAVDLVRTETVQYLALLSDVMGRYRIAIDEIRPADAVSEPHEEYVDAVTLVVDALPSTRTAVESAESIEDVQLALTSSGFADGQLRWTAACRSLEQAVRNEGRGIDLRCVVEAAP